MISTNNLTIQFGVKPLFENINAKFGGGNRYGLIGANGCGKSTLMKILGGDLEPSSGNVMLEPNVRLGKLKQDQFAYEDVRVLDVVVMGHTEMWKVATERDAIYANPDATEDDYMHAAELEAKFAEYDGYSAEARAGELLLGAGISEDLHQQNMSAVAPGWKLRVLLAQALFSNPGVLLLDEPTNNLDIHTITWLENTLNERDSTMIIISHDRHFLNQVCTHMADMDYGTLRVYPGNYDDYMQASLQARQQVLSANTKAKERVQDLQDFVRRFAANKSKSRQATSRLKQIDKIKVDDIKPSSRQHPFIRFEFEKKLHSAVFAAENIEKTFDRTLFKKLSVSIAAGEKVAIIGENGVGKTTFLKILLQHLQADKGSLKVAEHASIGYMPQDTNECFPKSLDLYNWLYSHAQPGEDEQSLRGILGRLLFSADEIKKDVKVLSGGEKGRMVWGSLMLGKHNVLALDEPTNHMDMESIESLQIALEKFTGTLLFISHDREFVGRIATRIIEIKETEVIDYAGDYETYVEIQEAKAKLEKAEKSKK